MYCILFKIVTDSSLAKGFGKKSWLTAAFSVALVFLLSATAWSAQIKIGVLAKRGADQCLAQWSPTAEYLTEALPGWQFEIIPISFADILNVVRNGEVEFVLANPSIYVELEIDSGIDRIATLRNRRLWGTHTSFGSVIFFCENVLISAI